MNIITNKIYIGSSQDAITATNDIILNVAIDLETHPSNNRFKIGLIDGPGNKQDTFNQAVDFIKQNINNDILVHCHSGHYRSVMTVACAISDDIESFKKNLNIIMNIRGVPNYRQALYELALNYFTEKKII